MSYYDPYSTAGLNDDGLRNGGIADRMYRRLHDGQGGGGGMNTTSNKPKGLGRPPVALTCYLCGQQFGTASLEIHQRQCYAKKLLQWEKGDPAVRGPKPQLRSQQDLQQITDGINDSRSAQGMGGGGNAYSGMSAKQMEQFNNNQFQEYQDKALVPCENCGRTFLPDRLQVHLRSCKPGATARKVVRKEVGSPMTPSAAQGSPDNRPLPKRQEASPVSFGSVRVGSGGGPSPAQRSKQSAVATSEGDSAGYGDEYMYPEEEECHGADAYNDLNGLDDHSPSLSMGGAHEADISGSASPEGRRAGGPVIPHLHLNTKGPQSPLDCDGDDHESYEAVKLNGPPDLDEDSGRSAGEDSQSPSSASPPMPKPKPKVAIDRPLDLSHVQSRFKQGMAGSNLERCQYCKRTFAPDRLSKHEDVCIEKKAIKTGATVGMTPRMAGGSGKVMESIIRPATSSGAGPSTSRSGAATSRVMSSGYGTSRGIASDNGPLTTRGAPSSANKIIRPANASSRPQSPSVGRPASRSPPPGQRTSVERGPATTRAAPTRIIQPAARHPSPPSHHASSSHAPAEESARPKFCTECGSRLYAAVQKFCGECGHRVEA